MSGVTRRNMGPDAGRGPAPIASVGSMHHVAATAASAPEPGGAAARLQAGSLSADAFKGLFRGHAGGVAVIAADAGDGPVALTATSVSSVSAEPPLLIFSVSTQSSAAASIVRAETVVVHLLDADDLALARLGAERGADRFADRSSWRRLATGEPAFHGVRAWVRCAVISRMGAGASTVVAAHALETHVEREPGATDGLVHHDRTWHRLGEHSRIG